MNPPLTVLRRLDCVLADTEGRVLKSGAGGQGPRRPRQAAEAGVRVRVLQHVPLRLRQAAGCASSWSTTCWKLIALPEQLFYNTGIATYVSAVTNRKAPARKGKVQLIDATFAGRETSRAFPTTHFGFRKITVERPLRLNFQASPERIARLDGEKGFRALVQSKKKGARYCSGCPRIS